MKKLIPILLILTLFLTGCTDEISELVDKGIEKLENNETVIIKEVETMEEAEEFIEETKEKLGTNQIIKDVNIEVIEEPEVVEEPIEPVDEIEGEIVRDKVEDDFLIKDKDTLNYIRLLAKPYRTEGTTIQ